MKSKDDQNTIIKASYYVNMVVKIDCTIITLDLQLKPLIALDVLSMLVVVVNYACYIISYQ